ncbi:MAG: hypothetical protein U0167_13330 [bacterium]
MPVKELWPSVAPKGAGMEGSSVQSCHYVRCIAAVLSVAVATLGDPGPSRAGLIGITLGSPGTTLYDISIANGAPTNPRTVASKINTIAVAPSGTIYAVSQGFPSDVPPGGSLYTINPSTGVPTPVGVLNEFIVTEGDLACDPTTGILYAVDGVGELFTINTSTAACTVVGTVTVAFNEDLSAMAFDSAGTLYMVDSFGPSLVKVNKSTAAVIGSVTMNADVNREIGGLAFDPMSGVAYYAAGTTSMLYTVNTTTGLATPVGPIAAPTGISGLAFYDVGPTPTDRVGWGSIKGRYR